MSDRSGKPVIVAIVSGKGGVGKTMLSVAFAKELSRASKTLLIDLDFFNRGLTGLLLEGKTLASIDKPDFLNTPDAVPRTKRTPWNIVKVAPNLFHLAYPHLTPAEMRKFETLDVGELRESLCRFLAKAAEICGCEGIVLDCHGGPDNSSFAACLLADYSLLISEPDRITFYGTLNFLRQLEQVAGNQEVDIRLVFNKVITAFSPFFLRSLYQRRFSKLFGGRPLMGLFPLEVYLTKDFEKTPFLTSVYPYSYLNQKTRVLVYDLLAEQHAGLLSPAVRSMPKLMRWERRITLGRPFFLFDINFIMGTLVGVGILHLFLDYLPKWESSQHRPVLTFLLQRLSPVIGFVHKYTDQIMFVYIGAILLFAITLYMSWRSLLSRAFTYAIRLKKIAPAIMYWLAIGLLWMIPILIVAGVMSAVSSDGGERIVTMSLIEAAYALFLLPEAYRVYRDLRYEPHFIESGLRCVMLAYALGFPFVLKDLLS